MKAYGLPNKKSSAYCDKKRARQSALKEIVKDLQYYNYYHMPWFEQPWDFKYYEEIERDHK